MSGPAQTHEGRTGGPAATLRQRLPGSDPVVADRWMRGAVALLLRLQAPSEGAGQPPTGPGPAAALDDFARRVAATQGATATAWPAVRTALLAEAQAQPQAAGPDGFGLGAVVIVGDDEARPGGAMRPVIGPATHGIAALLRDGALAFDEEREIDWAIRWWSGARRAGLLGDHDMAGDFGLCWRAIEWSGVRLHLAALGADPAGPGHPLAVGDGWQSRLGAQVVRCATRYRELAPLAPLVERLCGSMTQSGFELR